MSSISVATSTLRTWTDQQLRDAVATQRSWRGVARALGLRPTSTSAVRRSAARLNLDTSHFRGQPAWSDEQIAEAIAGGGSWSDVLQALGARATDEHLLRLKGRAVRLGVDTSHLSVPPAAATPASVLTAQPRREMLRVAATSIASAWFALRGFPTAVPLEPQEYDLLVTLPEGISRIQVKSSTCQVANGRWQVRIGRRPYTLDNAAGRTPYDPDSLDYFFVVVGDGRLFLIPSAVLAGRMSMYADSYSMYRVGDVSSLLVV